MPCGLLKLSRILRDGCPERRSFCERAARARIRSERGAHARSAIEQGSAGTGERELAEWTVSVDNFS
jgi:hypothetical protein